MERKHFFQREDYNLLVVFLPVFTFNNLFIFPPPRPRTTATSQVLKLNYYAGEKDGVPSDKKGSITVDRDAEITAEGKQLVIVSSFGMQPHMRVTCYTWLFTHTYTHTHTHTITQTHIYLIHTSRLTNQHRKRNTASGASPHQAPTKPRPTHRSCAMWSLRNVAKGTKSCCLALACGWPKRARAWARPRERSSASSCSRRTTGPMS